MSKQEIEGIIKRDNNHNEQELRKQYKKAQSSDSANSPKVENYSPTQPSEYKSELILTDLDLSQEEKP